jgi:hypothetical protein
VIKNTGSCVDKSDHKKVIVYVATENLLGNYKKRNIEYGKEMKKASQALSHNTSRLYRNLIIDLGNLRKWIRDKCSALLFFDASMKYT